MSSGRQISTPDYSGPDRRAKSTSAIRNWLMVAISGGTLLIGFFGGMKLRGAQESTWTQAAQDVALNKESWNHAAAATAAHSEALSNHERRLTSVEKVVEGQKESFNEFKSDIKGDVNRINDKLDTILERLPR